MLENNKGSMDDTNKQKMDSSAEKIGNGDINQLPNIEQLFSSPINQQKTDFRQSLDVTAQCVIHILGSKKESKVGQKAKARFEELWDLINKKQ